MIAEERVELQQFIASYFNMQELEDLAFRLKVDFEELAGQTKTARIRALIQDAERKGYDARLKELVQELRPRANLWGGYSRVSIEFMPVVYTSPDDVPKVEPFFGRDKIVTSLVGELRAKKRVAVHGLAGSGKTALSKVIAREYLSSGAGKVIWQDFGSMEAETFKDALAQELGTEEERHKVQRYSGERDVTIMHQMLSRHNPALLILDNVIEVGQLQECLKAVPDSIAVLVVSRIIYAYRIDVIHRLEDLDENAGLAMLGYHAGQSYLEDDAAKQLVKSIGNHAQALLLAGTLLKGGQLMPAHLARQVAQAPHKIEVPGLDSIEMLLDKSYDALPENCREALTNAGRLPAAGATPELLAAFINVSPVEAAIALDRLIWHSLVERSYHEAWPGEDGTSEQVAFYTFHDLTFSYAQSLARDAGANLDSSVEVVAGYVDGYAGDVLRMHLDQANILAAAEIALERDSEHLITIVAGLLGGGYVDAYGFSLGLLRLTDATIDSLKDDTSQRDLLHVLYSKRGNAYYDRGNAENALATYQLALNSAPNQGRKVILNAVMGKVAARLGQVEEQERFFATARELAGGEGGDRQLLFIYQQQAHAAAMVADFEQTCVLAKKGIEISRRVGDDKKEAYFRLNLGSAIYDLGVREALADHLVALELAKAAGSVSLEANILYALAFDHHALKESDKAREYLVQARKLFAVTGHTAKENEAKEFMKTFGYITEEGKISASDRQP